MFCLVLLAFLTSFNDACRIDYELEPWQVGRQFFVSDDAPVTQVLNTVPGAAGNAQLILDHVRNVEDAVYFARQLERSNSTINDHERFETCNHKDPPFRRQAFQKFGAFGWPFADTSCVTDSFSEDGIQNLNMTKTDSSEYTFQDVSIALSNYANTLRDNAKKLAQAAGLNFSRPDSGANYEVGFFSGERCISQSVAAVRFDDNWYLRAVFSSERTYHFVALGERRGVVEFPTVINGTFSSPKKMCLRVDNKTEVRKQGTTQIGHWGGGNTHPGMFGKILVDQNPSMKAALGKSDEFIQQANDALAPSNIAILVLPLFLNLVPIALISHVTTSFMLFYTVLTDILTVIPLGIKGVELISIGSSTHRSVVVRISSSFVLPRSRAAAADVWSSECYAPSNVQRIGIIFLALSIVSMVVGIAVEVLAHAYMRRKRDLLMKEFHSSTLQEAEPLVFVGGGNDSSAHLWHASEEKQTQRSRLESTGGSQKLHSHPLEAPGNHNMQNKKEPQEQQLENAKMIIVATSTNIK